MLFSFVFLFVLSASRAKAFVSGINYRILFFFQSSSIPDSQRFDFQPFILIFQSCLGLNTFFFSSGLAIRLLFTLTISVFISFVFSSNDALFHSFFSRHEYCVFVYRKSTEGQSLSSLQNMHMFNESFNVMQQFIFSVKYHMELNNKVNGSILNFPIKKWGTFIKGVWK